MEELVKMFEIHNSNREGHMTDEIGYDIRSNWPLLKPLAPNPSWGCCKPSEGFNASSCCNILESSSLNDRKSPGKTK